MLFNSHEFLFVFLPITLLGFFLCRHFHLPRTAMAWLVLASLVFYAWWNPIYVCLLIGPNALGFCGHPGFKTAMAEDLIMEFEEGPDDPAPQLERLQLMAREIEDALVRIMTGIVKVTGLMQPRHRIPISLKT